MGPCCVSSTQVLPVTNLIIEKIRLLSHSERQKKNNTHTIERDQRGRSHVQQ